MKVMRAKRGFTLVEVLIVVVIMAVLAATIIPQFSDTTADARKNTAIFNLQTMRSQIETFRAQHNGTLPADLDIMTKKSDKSGAFNAAGPYGPYIQAVPLETITDSNNVSILSANSPISSADVDGKLGWLYNRTTGEIRVNDVPSLIY